MEKTNFPSFLDESEWHPPIIHIVDKKSRIDGTKRRGFSIFEVLIRWTNLALIQLKIKFY
jgi:hypothetical protein